MSVPHSEHLFRAFRADADDAAGVGGRYVDATLTGYVEDASSASGVRLLTPASPCHRLVLGCKSDFLRRLLLSAGGGDVANDAGPASVVVAGLDAAGVDAMLDDFYSAGVTYVKVWPGEEPGGPDPLLLNNCVQVKLEAEDAAADEAADTAREKNWAEKEKEILANANLSLKDVNELVSARSPSLSYEPIDTNNHSVRLNFDRVLWYDRPVSFARCRNCQKLFRCPFAGKQLGKVTRLLNKHAKLECCIDTIMEVDASSSVAGKSAGPKKCKEETTKVSRLLLSQLIDSCSESVKFVDPGEQDLEQCGEWESYKLIEYQGRAVDFVWCRRCEMVFTFDLSSDHIMSLSTHLCIAAGQQGLGMPGLVKPDYGIEELEEEEEEEVTRTLLKQLIDHQSPLVSLIPDDSESVPRNSKLTEIRYKGMPVPMLFCSKCFDIVPKSELETHICTVLISTLDVLMAEDPNRLTLVQDQIVNDAYPFINPVLLDGNETGCVQCQFCKEFMEKGKVIEQEGIDVSFQHSCHKIRTSNRDRRKLRSVKRKRESMPKTGVDTTNITSGKRKRNAKQYDAEELHGGEVGETAAEDTECKLSKEEIQQLVNEHSPLVTLKFNNLSNTLRQLSSGSKLKGIYYQGRQIMLLLCLFCAKVIEKAEIAEHECFVLVCNMVKIFAEEPERLKVKDEVLNYKYSFVKPVLLDGADTGAVQCQPCHEFLPRGSVANDSPFFKHRCLRLPKHGNTEKFHSDNLIITKCGKGKEYKCKLCKELFNTDHNAEVHMRTVHNEGSREVLCSFCGKPYPTFRAVRNHEVMAHIRSEEVTNRFACTKCDRRFYEKNKLERHMRGAHSDVRHYVCDICGKDFNFETTLKNHKLTHGEKTFRCDICGKSFLQNKTFVNHRRTHTGEKPHACPFCDMRFIQITACKTHVLGRHGLVVPKGVGMKAFKESLEKAKLKQEEAFFPESM